MVVSSGSVMTTLFLTNFGCFNPDRFVVLVTISGLLSSFIACYCGVWGDGEF